MRNQNLLSREPQKIRDDRCPLPAGTRRLLDQKERAMAIIDGHLRQRQVRLNGLKDIAKCVRDPARQAAGDLHLKGQRDRLEKSSSPHRLFC